MLALSLIVNLAVLFPLCAGLLRGGPGIVQLYGGPSPALGILTAVYLAIGAASALILVLLARGVPQTRDLAITLLGLQILYKVLTLPLVGPGHVVVTSNLIIAALHSVTLWTLLNPSE